jgi:ABC-type glycerol-3-phosphate transport system substrate-binding protein
LQKNRKTEINEEEEKMMKKRIMAVLALAMTIAVLAAGTAHAEVPPALTTVTNQASASSVAPGEPVTFHMTVTNNEPYALGPVWAKGQFLVDLNDGVPVKFVSASSSQGQCYFEPHSGVHGAVFCELGTLPAGATADIDFVVIPQDSGLLTNMADSFELPVGGKMEPLSPYAPASVWVYPA